MIKIFSNIKVGTQIMAGYLIVLALMGVVGSLGIWRLNQVNTSVVNLSDNLAEDKSLAQDRVSQILLLRFYGNKHVRNQDLADEEVTASAQPQSEMAQNLLEVVARFKLTNTATQGPGKDHHSRSASSGRSTPQPEDTRVLLFAER